MALPTLPKLPTIGATTQPIPADTAPQESAAAAFDIGGLGGGGIDLEGIIGGVGGGGIFNLPGLGGGSTGFLPSPGCINDPQLGINTCGTENNSPTGIPGLGSVILLPGGGVGVGTGSPVATPGLGSGSLATLAGFGSSAFGSIFGASLLRIAFFLLGLIAIIGAIYLFKDTRPIIQGAVRGARRAVRAVSEASEGAAA